MARRLTHSSSGSGRCFPLLLVLALLTTPTVLGASDNDAGTGSDAPATWQAAMEVPMQAFEGALDVNAGDDRDWYRVQVPTDKLVRIHIEATGDESVRIEMRRDDGGYWQYSYVSPGWTRTLDVFKSAEGALRLGFTNRYDPASYSVTFTVHDLPDSRVDVISVRPLNFTTDAGELQTGTLREVNVTVTNIGDAAAPGASVRAWVTSPIGTSSSRVLGTIDTPLEPGESRTVTFTWDALGQFGDATVHAHISTSWDDDASNNYASTGAYAMLGNSGLGVDVLSNRVGTYLPFVGSASASTSWDAGLKGAHVRGPAVGVTVGPSGGNVASACVVGICRAV